MVPINLTFCGTMFVPFLEPPVPARVELRHTKYKKGLTLNVVVINIFTHYTKVNHHVIASHFQAYIKRIFSLYTLDRFYSLKNNAIQINRILFEMIT